MVKIGASQIIPLFFFIYRKHEKWEYEYIELKWIIKCMSFNLFFGSSTKNILGVLLSCFILYPRQMNKFSNGNECIFIIAATAYACVMWTHVKWQHILSSILPNYTPTAVTQYFSALLTNTYGDILMTLFWPVDGALGIFCASPGYSTIIHQSVHIKSTATRIQNIPHILFKCTEHSNLNLTEIP